MHKQVLFRDYYEQQAIDHNNIQAYARATLDALVKDAVTASRRYAGFAVVKTATAEVQVAAGRFFDVEGAVHARSGTLTQSLLASLPAVAKRIVTVSASGVETETDVTERDYLTNVETGQTEPRSVATTRSRDAVLHFTGGAESVDPQPPVLPVDHVAVADVLLDTTGVVSVTMRAANAVASTEDLDGRTDLLEAFRDAIDPRVRSLASDLAALQAQLNALSRLGPGPLYKLMEDVARVKERLKVPDTFAAYGADVFDDEDESDTDNSQGLGYDALVLGGLRFADANADEFEVSLFSANDPNAALSNGLLLPKFDDDKKIEIGPYHSDLALTQFQSWNLVQKTMKQTVDLVGQRFTGYAYKQGGAILQPVVTPGGSVQTGEWVYAASGGYEVPTFESYHYSKDITVPYTTLETVEHAIAGGQLAQTVLIANDTWLTRVGFWMTQKAANEAVYVTICETTLGQPDLTKVLAHVQVAHTALVVGDWTEVPIPPTYIQKGQRVAVVLTANAGHRFGLAEAGSYHEGTMFQTADGSYYLGDLTKDLMVRLYGAKFRAPQVLIEFAAVNLDGGIRSIELQAGTIVPPGTQLVYEIRPGGSGAWFPLDRAAVEALATAPPLFQFRARFVGSTDIMPGVRLTGSRMKVARPKTTFKHISEPITLGAATNTIVVKVQAFAFHDTPHDLGCRLRVGAAWETPDTTSTVVLEEIDADNLIVERTFTFSGLAAVTTFAIEITGTTNTAADVFSVLERVHYST